MTQVDHVNHLEVISLTDWQTMPCERAGKTAGLEYLELAFRGLTFVPLDCVYWLLYLEKDGPLNVLSAPKGFFPVITG